MKDRRGAEKNEQDRIELTERRWQSLDRIFAGNCFLKRCSNYHSD